MSQNPLKGLLEGVIMVDETYVGGNPKNFSNTKKRQQTKTGRGTDKAPVVALVERGGRVRSWPIANITANTLQSAIRDHVSPKAAIQTNQLISYRASASGSRAAMRR